MRHEVITTANAPSSPTWSQAVKVGSHIYVSGMIGADPQTGQVAGPSIQEQTRQALTNCEAVLVAAGASLDDVVDVTVLLFKPEDFAGMNEAYVEVFPTDPPARMTTQLGVSLPGVLVSVRMTAVVD